MLINHFLKAIAAFIIIVCGTTAYGPEANGRTLSLKMKSEDPILISPNDGPLDVRHYSIQPLTNESHWSNTSLTLRASSFDIIMHNITTYIDEQGSQRQRWLKMEVFPRSRRLRQGKQIAEPMKRGFWVTPPSIWPGRTQHRRAIITLCYEDRTALNYLDGDVKVAIERWHDALGSDRGVEFKIIDGVLCGLKSKGFGLDTVQIQFMPSGDSGATIGYKQLVKDKDGKFVGRDASNRFWPFRRHLVFLKAQGAKTTDGLRSSAGTATHELGHVVGLEHEHQRPDAPQYVEFICRNMNNYAVTELSLTFNPVHLLYGSLATMEDACTDIYVAGELKRRGWSAWAFMPVPTADQEAWGRGRLQSLSVSDFESIMLYSGRQGSVGEDGKHKNVLVRRDDGTPIEPNEFPSKGDVDAVKQMYPDIEESDTSATQSEDSDT